MLAIGGNEYDGKFLHLYSQDTHGPDIAGRVFTFYFSAQRHDKSRCERKENLHTPLHEDPQVELVDETGRGSAQLLAPLEWPPQSPDLSSCDNALCEYIKQKIASRRYYTTDEPKEAVDNAYACITPAMLQRILHRIWTRIILCYSWTTTLTL
ncbi:hypothetical protein PR048_004398 [Dryococelus australis]|uniref:Uncharacterized protein n=1 Tax=Dryococelus australis TaxID=614101 RepID=A0ABQ9I5B8_9NEOP|nr:hypothetical protein PR048_004398 [Dryococelus australis]